MRKALYVFLIVMLASSVASALNFTPTLMKLSANPVIHYDFDGSKLTIPIQVSGTSAGVIFSVFTRGKADKIPETINGFIGWHQVNKVDTCIYFSTIKNMGIGANTIEWNGKDQDGGTVPAGDYTYYLWAFDNQGAKNKMCNFSIAQSRYFEVQEVDVNGLPLANPIYYEFKKRWIIGNDPLDSTLVETSNITPAQGWATRTKPAMDSHDLNYFYVKVLNGDARTACITKYKWVPGGDAEFQAGFGDNGYSIAMSTPAGGSDSGVLADDTYIFTSDRDEYATQPPVDFYIYDYDGAMVAEIDLQKWWSPPEDYAAGAQANGGPNDIMERNGKIFMNCHCSCLKQMVDPYRYLETQSSDDFFVWSNRNGDYVLDHNFEDTAKLKWVCMDYNVGPYTYGIDADNNLFSQCSAYDVGAVAFGLMAPDGTGIGYFAYAGETSGWKKGSFFIDSGTSFDGLYTDNEQAGGTHYQEGGWKANEYTTGTYFIGHDSITGVITSAVGVAENAPAAFSVAQNSPNPFNPTTTISFTIAEAGNVTADIYNVAGQKVETLVNGFMDAGSHSVVWDASSFSAGVYFYTVKAGGFSRTMKMTLLK